MDYSSNVGYVGGAGGVLTFQKCLNYYNNLNTEVWVAYVANEPVKDPNNINKSGIEMYMSVTTSENAIFTAHMGIQRVPCKNSHKNISVSLHAFCAKTMHECYPDKISMFSAPQEVMRDILFSAIPDKNNKIYIDYPFDIDDSKLNDEMIGLQLKIESAQKAGRSIKSTMIPKLHLCEHLLVQREKINKGELFPQITYSKNETCINDKDIGNQLVSMSRDNPEYNWFYKNYEFRSEFQDTPMISVDLLALAA